MSRKRHQLSAFSLQLAWLLLAMPCLAQTVPDMGASVSVTVEPNGDTTLDVKKGELKVKANGQETRAHAGDTLKAQKGKPVRRLLRPPVVTAPADGATLNAKDVAVAWQKVPGAARYVVEIASSPEMLAARTQTVTDVRAVIHVDAGTWYWRVVALDADGQAGKKLPPRRLTVDTTPPKLKTGKPEWK